MKTFNDMPPHSRVWIYQSGRTFTNEEVRQIKIAADEFVDQWSSHGSVMDACVEVFHNLFVVVCVDENSAPASGCGIDKSVRFIQQLETEMKTSLLDRMNLAFKKEEKVISCKLSEAKEFLKNNFGDQTENIYFFNNLIQIKSDLEKKWILPIKDSWLAEKLV